MATTRLRTLVSTIGLAVALVTAVAAPVSFLWDAYSDTTRTLDLKAGLSGNRVAQYIYAHDSLWQYQQLRLQELIEFPYADGEALQQRIYAEDGQLVLEIGAQPESPTISRRLPILVSGQPRGYLEAVTSFRSHIYETGLVALLSSLLGFGMYFALRIFPLRVLDRTMGALQQSQQNLATQNERLDTALTNMSMGLCMFDAQERLVVANGRFAEIFRVPLELVTPGRTIQELLELAFRKAGRKEVDLQDTLKLTRRFIVERSYGYAVHQTGDGRSIAMTHRPAPNGGFVATFEDITERLLAEEKIKFLAHHDALTGLLNRVAFYERLDGIVGRLPRSKPLAVLSLDLDRFKNVNDTLGHPVGDLLLQAAADRMRSCTRGEDVIARLGGDEFAILQLESQHPADVTALASRLVEVLGTPFDLDGHQVVVAASIGISMAPNDGNMPDVLMKNADLALYRAKADGGGTYRFFELDMDARMQERRGLELDLRKAIVTNEFEVYYQPIIDVKTGTVTGCEALVRWHHPTRGMISPMEFIPIAEETGLIVPLGEWVLRQACAEAATWPSQVTIAVNLSPAQFKSKNLVTAVTQALVSSGLPASRLELEITELVLIQDNESAFAILHQLRDLGIRIAMDDFGTGYSSLGYLRSFPFDKIKIDQSFIQDLPHKEESLAIVRAVVGLSSSLGIVTTAEGVETDEQLSSVTSEGCTEFQGYLFSHPQTAGDIARTLGEQEQRKIA
ncbi:MAG: EAL domain-containing protein [Arenimonas sp.]|nr:EAL domain-containing protein [Rhizobium sp.]MBW8446298.1 EAL domain-containing protein [Arenimonas sp.]